LLSAVAFKIQLESPHVVSYNELAALGKSAVMVLARLFVFIRRRGFK
jgi:hypothetical protein